VALTRGPTFQVVEGKRWATYACSRCSNVILATARKDGFPLDALYPSSAGVDPDVPTRAREYLEQAIASQHAPAASIMVAASAVDAMLKEKGLITGTLNTRINDAATRHLITAEMAEWAHAVRLDANDQRHADEGAKLPTTQDAERVIEFAQALAQFLFVLPARVARGRQQAGP
jgi:hypothetical protein